MKIYCAGKYYRVQSTCAGGVEDDQPTPGAVNDMVAVDVGYLDRELEPEK